MSALVGSWSAIVLRGVVAIVFGVFALLLPGLTVGVVIVIFAVFTIVYGLIARSARSSPGATISRGWGSC